MLRPYQQEASDSAFDWVMSCVDPCLIIAATGAGKSHIIADLSQRIHKVSGKKILNLAPSAKLVDQNRKKFLATGSPASVFSASLGKTLKHPVVFGTPGTVVNQLQRFGQDYAAVVVDEAHGITPTLMTIINHMRQANPLLRVIGLSATPYRLGTGYIYQHHYRLGRMDEAIDPFFHTAVYEIGARWLIDNDYLTPPVFDDVVDHYDTSGLVMNSKGQWDNADQAFVGKGRKTYNIVSDVIAKSVNRRGVMLFAATVEHAEEVMASLPPHLSGIVTGTVTSDRALEKFEAGQIKYLVSVGKLTTGFDCTHVDVIALLRRTESVALLQQIIGRGLRLHDGKRNCLVLDYGENIENHCPDGDLFNPQIVARKSVEGGSIEIPCPQCHYPNLFGARKNDDGYSIDANGYFTDLAGVSTGIPAHYGRRCQGETVMAGHHVQCTYKWACKVCVACSHENDIAARYCKACRAEIIDPNEKLKIEAAKLANDPYRLRTASVISWAFVKHKSMTSGADSLRVDYDIDEAPHKLSEYVGIGSDQPWRAKQARTFCRKVGLDDIDSIDQAVDRFTEAKVPSTIAYRKKPNSRFFTIEGIQ